MTFLRHARYAAAYFALSFIEIGCASSHGPTSAFSPDAAIADTGATAEAGSPCASDDECAKDHYCGFDITGGCDAPGSCRLRKNDGVCSATDFVTVCTCGGGTVEYCQEPAPMYTATRIAHAGPCQDGGQDAAAE
jgi:hypothetical protein